MPGPKTAHVADHRVAPRDQGGHDRRFLIDNLLKAVHGKDLLCFTIVILYVLV